MKTLLLFILALSVVKTLVPEDPGEDLGEDDDSFEDMAVLSNQEIDHASQSQTEVKLIEVLEERKKREMESYKRAKKDDTDTYHQSDYYSVSMREHSSWIFEHKKRLIRVTLIFLIVGLVALISWKLYSIKKSVEEQNLHMKKYTEQMENMIEGADKLKFVTWKDQKEGILFVENLFYSKKNTINIPKVQLLHDDIEKLDAELRKQMTAIQRLKEKESAYVSEIDQLNHEYDKKKKEVLEEGVALGHGENVLREFK